MDAIFFEDKDKISIFFYLPVSTFSAATQGYWIISYDNGVTYHNINDKNWNLIIAVGKDGDSFFYSVKVTKDELFIELADGIEFVIPLGEQLPYKAIDLGLSVRWASFNVGASSATEPGELYL